MNTNDVQQLNDLFESSAIVEGPMDFVKSLAKKVTGMKPNTTASAKEIKAKINDLRKQLADTENDILDIDPAYITTKSLMTNYDSVKHHIPNSEVASNEPKADKSNYASSNSTDMTTVLDKYKKTPSKTAPNTTKITQPRNTSAYVNSETEDAVDLELLNKKIDNLKSLLAKYKDEIKGNQATMKLSSTNDFRKTQLSKGIAQREESIIEVGRELAELEKKKKSHPAEPKVTKVSKSTDADQLKKNIADLEARLVDFNKRIESNRNAIANETSQPTINSLNRGIKNFEKIIDKTNKALNDLKNI